MPDLSGTLELAKRGKLSRAQVYAGMSALAEQRRAPGESTAQAFVKFIAGEGAELMQVHSALGAAGSGDVVSDHAVASPPAPITKSAGSGEWHMLVDVCKRAHRQAHPRATENEANAAAVNAAMSTPGGMSLFRATKRAEQAASGLFAPDDLTMLDGAEAEVQAHDDMRKRANQHMSEFEHMLADTMQKYPHMTESDAGDHVRSTASGMEAWTRHKGVPGKNGVHNMGYEENPSGATSGRTDSPRTSDWSSDHSDSAPVTPSRVPMRPSESPAVKQWNDLKRRAMFDYGYSEARTVEILKCLPAGRRAIERVIEEARASVAR